jgi:hypothetical protein
VAEDREVAHVSIQGKWNITVNSPMGAQKSVLELKPDGVVLTGSGETPQGPQPITNGKVDGSSFSWDFAITSPMPMTLSFAGTVEGDKLSGKVKAGAFGSFPFSGERTG